MKTTTFFISFLFFLLVSSCLPSVALGKPYWLKEGFAATYKVRSSGLISEIIEVVDHNEVHCRGPAWGNGTYSWEVKSLSGSYAEADVHLDLVAEYWSDELSGYVTGAWNKTASVKIDVDNRDTMALNGTNLGKINYWIDPNVVKWDTVTIYGKPPYEINATVMNYLYNPVKTPAGDFDCWHVYVKAKKTRPDVGITAHLDLWYDKATGILVAAQVYYYDVVLMLMGVIRMTVFHKGDFQAPSSFVLQSLTTSSPSSPQFLNLYDYVPYIVAAVAVAAIPTAIYLTRRKRKKTHTTE
jgi:hypothetical protein